MKKMLTKKEIILIISVVLFLAVIGVGFWYFMDYTTKSENGGSEKTTKEADQCGKLIVEGGITSSLAPFSPTLRAKITGDYDRTTAICEWTINKVPIPNTYPVLGDCVFGGRAFATPGQYKLIYTVEGLSGCPKSATIVVK